MGTILFECPKTGSAVSTGVETEPISFCRLSKTWLELYCPLCGHFPRTVLRAYRSCRERRYGLLRKRRLT